MTPSWTGSIPYSVDDRHQDRHEHEDDRRRLEEDAEEDQQHVQQQQEDDRVVGQAREPLAEVARHLLAGEHLTHEVRRAEDQQDAAGDDDRLLGRPPEHPPGSACGRSAPRSEHVDRGDAGALGRGEPAAEDAAEDDDRQQRRADDPHRSPCRASRRRTGGVVATSGCSRTQTKT